MFVINHKKLLKLALAIACVGTVSVAAQAPASLCDASETLPMGDGIVEFGVLRNTDGKWMATDTLRLGRSEQLDLNDCAASCSGVAGCTAVGFQTKGFEKKPNCDYYNVFPTLVEKNEGFGEKGVMSVAVKGGCQDLRDCCKIYVQVS